MLIKGSPLHHTGLHRAIESHGAVVVAEDDWWGSRTITDEIPEQGNLTQEIFQTYYRKAPRPARIVRRMVSFCLGKCRRSCFLFAA